MEKDRKIKQKKEEPTPYELVTLGLQSIALVIQIIQAFKK